MDWRPSLPTCGRRLAAASFPDQLDDTWATHDEHSPPVDRLLACTDGAGKRWLVLEGHYKWSQRQNPEEAAAGAPHHTTWMQVRSYLINAVDVDAWTSWAEGQDWHGRWMPEAGSPTGLLLADHPYKSDWPNLEGRDRTANRESPPPGPLVVTTTWYGGVANNLDQSDSAHLHTFLPSTPFSKELDLHRDGDFRWGRAGVSMVESFSAREMGPDTVHISADTLRAGLASNGRYLFWTVLAEKDTVATDPVGPMTGSRFRAATRRRTCSTVCRSGCWTPIARTLHAGGGTSNVTTWSLPLHIPV